MWIMVAGPYRAADETGRRRNLAALNAAAVALLGSGHVPIIGVNLALPMIAAAGGDAAAYDRIMMPLSLALIARCDACLRLPGVSAGADAEAERFRSQGKPVYDRLAAVPPPTPP